MRVEFNKGDKVRVKADSLYRYKSEFASKVKGGRIGIVVGYRAPRHAGDSPIVEFPPSGRKILYRPGQVYWSDLELAE